MPIFSRFVMLLAAVLLCGPATVAVAQMPTVPQTGSGVSTQPPVDLGGGDGEDPAAKPDPPSGELPNTGSDPRLLFLAGVALTLLGVGLRLRTADADLY